jgi:hypothetical protein
MHPGCLLLWRAVIEERCKPCINAARTNQRDASWVTSHFVTVHKRMSQSGKVNPVIGMQM